MPTYEYRCKSCDHQFEIVQAFTEDSLTECPACSGTLKKVFGNVGITFKGSGFYKTDSRSGASSGGSTKETERSDTAPAAESPSTKGTESSKTKADDGGTKKVDKPAASASSTASSSGSDKT